MAGRIAEVRCMGSRADVGRDTRFVDADDIVPAALDQMVCHRGADDTAKPDDHNFCLLRKLCHFMRP